VTQIDEVRASAHTIPTDRPESDGTLEWVRYDHNTSIERAGVSSAFGRQPGAAPAVRAASVAHLLEQAHVVAARPVLDNHSVGNSPDVDERPRRRAARHRSAGEQWHRGGSVGPVQREVLRHEIAIADEVVLLDDDGSEVGGDPCSE